MDAECYTKDKYCEKTLQLPEEMLFKIKLFNDKATHKLFKEPPKCQGQILFELQYNNFIKSLNNTSDKQPTIVLPLYTPPTISSPVEPPKCYDEPNELYD
jgi:hypothetical protein